MAKINQNVFYKKQMLYNYSKIAQIYHIVVKIEQNFQNYLEIKKVVRINQNSFLKNGNVAQLFKF